MTVDYKSLFMHYLNQKGVRYDDLGEHRVRVTYNGENIPSLSVYLFFDKAGKNYVALDSWGIAKFSDEKMPAGLVTCNSLNAKYRWVKFYIDSESDVRCQADIVIEPETAGEECHELVIRIVDIVDEAYPEIMRALWA